MSHYVVYDPKKLMSKEALRVYEIGFGNRYRQREDAQLPDLGLGLTLWQGVFEDKADTWLRWCDDKGHLIPTDEERAVSAEAELEQLRAELARRTRKPAKKRAK